jgi:two-component system response regulator NreC
MAKIRILIADDHAVLRAGLRLLINAQADMEVVAEAKDGVEALARAGDTSPDVISLDFSMPGQSGVKLIERLRKEHPRTRVLVVTMHDDPAILSAVLAAGASGYLVKTAADTELLTAIRTVHQGRVFVNAQAEPKPGTGPALAGGPPELLSQREVEVLQLLVQGHTNKEISSKLFVSVKTVESHRARIMDKLGLRSRAELVRYALATGLLGATPPE